MEILEHLQLSALYHSVHGSADAVFAVVSVEDFLPGHQQDVAEIIVSLMHEGDVTPMAVLNRCSQQSRELVQFFVGRVSEEFYSTPTYCANAVRDAANKARVTASVTRALQALTTTSRDVSTVVAELSTDLDVAEASLDSGIGVIGFDEVMDTPDDSRPWVLPGMLRTNERIIITGPEGGGKSVLVSQLCLGAAMGVNTMSMGLDTHPPMRVLILDVENDRLQVKANMRKIYPYLSEISGGVTPLIEWVDVRDIDLANPVERQKIIRVAKERQPDLMYMGSLYKLAPEGEKADAQFTHVSRTVDRIRAETGTSVMLEAHTGHGMQNDRNGNMRPYGSSMWLRWPEFGIAMIHSRDKPVQIKHWRGARSDDREWPGGLRRGGAIPWTPITQDAWDAQYGE
jgi:hypothetical protein